MSLPPGLDSYEFKRTLTPSLDVPKFWHLRVQLEGEGIPVLEPDGKSPFTPISIPDIFGRPGPIEVEIGCGKGNFLVDYAGLHPDRAILGVEKEPAIAKLAAGRIAKRTTLPHARVLLGDCFHFFRDWMEDASVSVFHMYFPDPWPKKRHQKNRLMGPDFMAQVRRIAVPDAPFHWGTDHAEYNAEAQELFRATEWLQMETAEAGPTEGIMTNFEKKYRQQGKPIYRCVLRIRK